MNCKCGHEMKLIFVWDDAQQTERDHCYNLYACDNCGRICKEDVWSDEGLRWMNLDGAVEEVLAAAGGR